ncbi:unnamed protein product [Urochloa decumbens]|uniref:Uncharacterized protein n=1 Tax=Urochloa decumbens TaxID=240449 RepID=A0ABC9GCY4_9POAL
MTPIQVDWLEVFGGCSSSPDRADAPCPPSAPARRRAAAAGGRRRLRAAPEATARRPSVDAPAKENERDGEGSSAPAAKKSRNLDVEKEDALLHMLGEINKSLQASLKSPEPLQVPKDASPEEIFEALKGIPRLAHADRLRAYSMLTRDDRRFRSLMALPKSMRKEWLLMEIRSI